MNKEAIKSALAAIPTGDFLEKSKELLDTIGYRSELTLELSGTVHDFFEEFPPLNPNTKTEQEFRKHVESVKLVFQFTSDEIADGIQQRLFESDAFDKGNIKSFLFCAVELKDNNYSRTKYAEFTREINKRLFAPTVILFRTAKHLTVAFADRRPDKTDGDRDVLGQVTLIKDIRLNNPHRAHLDILSELSLEACVQWMNDKKKPKNFDGLLAAWLAKLDTEELNKQFYRKLFAWFEWAIEEATFPRDENRVIKPEEHVIRLITRLLFIWFIKEKGLVTNELFNKTQIQDLLKKDDFDNGDSYYRVVLQNLFFATLNTEIDKRKFSTVGYTTNRDFSRYRYKDQMRDPDKLLDIFAKTPFINGGLFDCLDTFKATGEESYRIDCFSDKQYKKLSIPNRLFFDTHQGLIPLLEHYKFTVEENTPIEQEVALDPELLGRVFENLLAAYNPETGATVRKQTGSYYTPRAIVDYMVEEALVATLSQKCDPTDGDAKLWDERLHYLLDYAQAFDDANEWFDEAEKDAVVRAISELKILDPAVGSGAFPMGMLHKLTLALRRLDPDNSRWEKLQKERAIQRTEVAFDTQDDEARREELVEIDETFKRYRDSDFGRKLYLIQNSIFGVDIQPVACQIAKLRFFISLAIEQEPEQNAENFGIKPLPNLETRFISTNTLIGLKGQRTLISNKAQNLEQKLRNNRERHFHATTRQRKRACKQRDEELRAELATELKHSGMPADDAERIARWDPYDQNATADWFDPEWMFGITEGFDVAIGNPPYVRADAGGKNAVLRQQIKDSKQYETLYEKWDLFIPFIERSYKMLNSGGFTTLIVSDAYCHAKYAIKSQEWFLRNSKILRLDFLSKIKIFDASVKNIIYLFQRVDGSENKPERRVHEDEFGSVQLLLTDEQQNLTQRAFFPEDTTTQQFTMPTITLDHICYVSVGMVVHADEKRAEGEFGLKDLVSDEKDEFHPKPFVEGKYLDRWVPATQKWLEWGTDRAPALFRRRTFSELYEVDEKLISISISASAEKLRVVYDNSKLYHNHSAWSFVPWHALAGVRNRSIQKQTRYRDEKKNPDLPNREDLEKISRCFAVKFLIGIMNSSCARDFLRANRRSNLNLYPDDWKKLPIPDVSPEQQAPIVVLVGKVLDAKRSDPNADISDLENEIDKLVYALYGLTPDEIAIVEARE